MANAAVAANAASAVNSANAVSPLLPAAVPVRQVHISLQTLLKVVQHSRDTAQPATGQLLGMDADGVLEVTDIFPFVPAIQDDAEQEEYQLEMMKSLRDVNVDHNTVGWYQSCNFDGPISAALIDAQLSYQNTIANSVVLVYDQLHSVQGPPALRALRLRPDFMLLYRDRRAKVLAPYAGLHMFEELPVKIRLSALEQAFLAQIIRDKALPPAGSAPLPEHRELLLSLAGQSVLAALDDVLAESGRLQYYLRTTTKQQQALSAQLQRLKHDNAQRAQNDEKQLPPATVMANFRPTIEPSRLPCLIASSNLHILLDECAAFVGTA